MTYRVPMSDWLEAEVPGLWQLPYKELIDALVDFRKGLRAMGDWATADRMRVLLAECGIEVHDTEDGAYWREA